jgi:hypothetical protein
MLEPTNFVVREMFYKVCTAVFTAFGLSTAGIMSIYYHIAVCLIVSEASVERLFSYFHRCTGLFLRKNLNYESLMNLGRIYVEYFAN